MGIELFLGRRVTDRVTDIWARSNEGVRNTFTSCQTHGRKFVHPPFRPCNTQMDH